MIILKNKKVSTVALVLVLTLAALITITFQAVQTTQAQAVNGTTQYPWPMMFGSYQRTGFQEGPAPSTAHLLWKAGPMGGPPSWGNAIAEGKVFQGDYNTGDVYAWDQNTGTQIWHKHLNVTAYPVMYYNGKIYTSGGSFEHTPEAVTGDEWVCLDASTGNIEWIWKIPDVINGIPQNNTIPPEGWLMVIPSQPTVYQDKLYINIAGGFAILDPDSGSVIQYMTNGDSTAAERAFDEGKMYGVVTNYTTGSQYGYCLDLTTLQEVWRTAQPVPSGSGLKSLGWPTLVANAVYYTSSDGTITKIDKSTGTIIWTHVPSMRTATSPPTTAWGPGPMIAYNRIFLGSADGALYSIDVFTDYTAQWKFQTGGYIYVQGAVADEKIYFGSSDGYVYCVDLSGNLVWKYNIGYSVTGSVGISDGKIYVAADDGYMYCFGPAPATSISLSVPTSITVGQSLAASGKFVDEAGVGIADAEVTLRYQVAPQINWTDIAALTTASDGSYSYTWTPPYDGYYTIKASCQEPEIGGYASASAMSTLKVASTTPEVTVNLEPIEDELDSMSSRLDNMTTYLISIIAVVAVAIIIGIVNLWALRKRK